MDRGEEGKGEEGMLLMKRWEMRLFLWSKANDHKARASTSPFVGSGEDMSLGWMDYGWTSGGGV